MSAVCPMGEEKESMVVVEARDGIARADMRASRFATNGRCGQDHWTLLSGNGLVYGDDHVPVLAGRDS